MINWISFSIYITSLFTRLKSVLHHIPIVLGREGKKWAVIGKNHGNVMIGHFHSGICKDSFHTYALNDWIDGLWHVWKHHLPGPLVNNTWSCRSQNTPDKAYQTKDCQITVFKILWLTDSSNLTMNSLSSLMTDMFANEYNCSASHWNPSFLDMSNLINLYAVGQNDLN